MENLVKIEYTVNGHTVLMYCSIDEFKDMLAHGIPDSTREINEFERLLKQPPKKVWVDNVLGCIDIDENGNRVYEDIVHDTGDGYLMYYIQESKQWSDKYNSVMYTIPEREDIPKQYWNKQVVDRWVKFPKE